MVVTGAGTTSTRERLGSTINTVDSTLLQRAVELRRIARGPLVVYRDRTNIIDVQAKRVELAACRSPEGNDVHGTMAFLKIWDTRSPDDAAFSGWMFADSPALNAVDHAVYDVWLIECKTSTDVPPPDAR